MTRVESFLSSIGEAIRELVRVMAGVVWLDGVAKGALGVVVLCVAAGVLGWAFGVAKRGQG